MSGPLERDTAVPTHQGPSEEVSLAGPLSGPRRDHWPQLCPESKWQPVTPGDPGEPQQPLAIFPLAQLSQPHTPKPGMDTQGPEGRNAREGLRSVCTLDTGELTRAEGHVCLPSLVIGRASEDKGGVFPLLPVLRFITLQLRAGVEGWPGFPRWGPAPRLPSPQPHSANTMPTPPELLPSPLFLKPAPITPGEPVSLS